MSVKKWVVCTNNEGYPTSLELRKLYPVIEDEEAERIGWLRIVDESGEDYMYPNDRFLAMDVAEPVEARLLALAA